MLYYKIVLTPKSGAELPEDTHLFWDFLHVLECNGQILQDYKVIKDEFYNLLVTLPEEDSLNEIYDSPYVKRERDKLNSMYTLAAVPLGINTGSTPYCRCSKRRALDMATHYFDFDSVFSCMDCGNPVAMYKLPLLDGEQDFYRVQSWQESYAAADTLWMNCLSDRFTGNQLTNPFSALNAEGREIAAELSKKLGYKVYYNMFDGGNFYKKFSKWENVEGVNYRLCPICGKRMELYKSENYKTLVCEECSLSSGTD